MARRAMARLPAACDRWRHDSASLPGTEHYSEGWAFKQCCRHLFCLPSCLITAGRDGCTSWALLGGLGAPVSAGSDHSDHSGWAFSLPRRDSHALPPWCSSMVLFHGALPWCSSMPCRHGALPWCSSRLPHPAGPAASRCRIGLQWASSHRMQKFNKYLYKVVSGQICRSRDQLGS